jgi:hypothetical protein
MGEIEGLGYRSSPISAHTNAGTEFPSSFFIVGAPRCGTTALSKALARNPRISFSKPKETHFFLEPRPNLSDTEARALYLGRYHPQLSLHHQALGEGSVSYLYSSDAIVRALRFDARAKFIVLVRNPLEMLPSYHSRMLYQLDEDVKDFAQAWALQDNRASGRNLPKRCRDPRLLQYGEVGKHGAHLERLFAVAGRERCLVIVFDDFKQAPRVVYEQVLDFLGVDDDGQAKFTRKRETSGFKSRWLQQFVMNPPHWLWRFIELSNPDKLLPRLKPIRRRIKKFNTYAQARPALSPEMRSVLQAYFAADVKKLSALLNRDLSHWE